MGGRLKATELEVEGLRLSSKNNVLDTLESPKTARETQ